MFHSQGDAISTWSTHSASAGFCCSCSTIAPGCSPRKKLPFLKSISSSSGSEAESVVRSAGAVSLEKETATIVHDAAAVPPAELVAAIEGFGFDAKLPVEIIVETDARNVAAMRHMPAQQIAYATDIPASPVSAGVHSIWYPVGTSYNGQHTNCLALSDAWTVVARAASSAVTEPIQWPSGEWRYYPAPVDPFVRPNRTVHAPTLAGVRTFKRGRVALLPIW